MNISPRRLASLVMSAIFLAFVGIALGFSENARLMPLIVGVPGLIISLGLLLFEKPGDTPSATEDMMGRKEIRLVVWLGLALVLITMIGFTWGSMVAMLVYFRMVTRESMLITWSSVMLCFLVFEVILNRLLGAQLFEGLLMPHIVRALG